MESIMKHSGEPQGVPLLQECNTWLNHYQVAL